MSPGDIDEKEGERDGETGREKADKAAEEDEQHDPPLHVSPRCAGRQ